MYFKFGNPFTARSNYASAVLGSYFCLSVRHTRAL